MTMCCKTVTAMELAFKFSSFVAVLQYLNKNYTKFLLKLILHAKNVQLKK